MTLFSARHSEAETPHWRAAAAISISRAVAPALRRYSCELRTARLPPVDMSPHTRLRARFSCGGANSAFTLLQSHSSSSATSMDSAVKLPCPISDLATRMTTVSSGSITTQAVISAAPPAARTGCGPNGISNPSASEPPTAATLARTERRSMCAMSFMAGAGHAERVLQHPQEGRAGIDVDVVRLSLDGETHRSLLNDEAGQSRRSGGLSDRRSRSSRRADAVVLQRDRAEALAGRRVDRVEHRRRGHPDRGLADSAPEAAGGHDNGLDLGHLADAQHVIGIEVRLLDRAILDRALAVDERGQAVDEGARHLPFDLGRIDRGARIGGADNTMDL